MDKTGQAGVFASIVIKFTSVRKARQVRRGGKDRRGRYGAGRFGTACVKAMLAGSLAALPAARVSAATASTSFGPGAYVIDMGQATQTIENGLKPYGLVYQLIITEGIPVQWAIDPAKSKDGADFTAGGKSYKGGSFIIAGDRVTAKVLEQLKTWKAKGVVVDGPLKAGFSAPIQKDLTSWPRAILDEQNDKLVVPFYNNAEIPVSSYITAGNPTMLTNCGDIYVLPHADPQDWTDASGYFEALRGFVADNGYLWSACHAVSALESIPGGNFLSQDGLVLWGDHDKGTPPYAYAAANAGDPIMQFLGSLDESTLNGSEQIFMPKSGGWRKTTTVAVYDPDHGQIGSGKVSPGPAAIVAYGRAYGDSKMGMVMVEAGHDLNAGTVASRVAAQRAYFNFLLLGGSQKAISITGTGLDQKLAAGRTYNLGVNAAGGVGALSYKWSSDCGGAFSNPTSRTTTFSVPDSATRCALKVEVSDNCGRVNFSSVVTNVSTNGDDGHTSFPDNQSTGVSVTFPNGSHSDPGDGSKVIGSDLTFPDLSVAVDKGGNPLPGKGEGKCESCPVAGPDGFVGPVINLTVTGIAEYRFKIYSTLGEFVCELTGKVEESDLPLLQMKVVNDAAGGHVEYLQRIVWTGRSRNGERVGTGAYILNAEIRYPADPAMNRGASTRSFLKKFGYLR